MSEIKSTSNLTDYTVLLVDDNPTNLQVLYQTLQGQDYKLLIAKNGEDALAVVEKANPQLILLDIMMPGMDGFEVCQRIKSDPRYSDPKYSDTAVIFLSALDDTADKVKGLEMGAVDYIAKPFQTGEVIARVNTHLTIYALKQQLQSENIQLHTKQAQLLQALGEGVIAVNEAGVITLCNPAAENILGRLNSEIVDKSFHTLLQHSDEHGNRFAESNSPLLATLQTKQARSLETFLWHGENRVLPVEMTLSPFDIPGTDCGAVIVFHDITERKEHEVALRNAMSEIESLKEKLQAENIYLQKEIHQQQDFGEIIGDSEALIKVLDQVKQVATTETSVLVYGESGTGKESIARAIHDNSERKDRPLIKVNCGAIPENLVESELFGHIKGSFTGAINDRQGHFELADKGTIFLDEFGELSLDVQVKLLRVLQEQEIQPVGSSQSKKIDVRIIAATNRDLKQMVDDNLFRLDLYYRLNVFPITVPPLRERRSDIPKLAEHFLAIYSNKFAKPVTHIDQMSIEQLMHYHWPGNIRELQNVIERSVILTTSSQLTIDSAMLPNEESVESSPDEGNNISAEVTRDTEITTLAENERRYITRVLDSVNWMVGGKGGAADILDLPSSTLRSRMKKLGIERP